MLDSSWRDVITVLRQKIRNTRSTGTNTVSLDQLESAIDDIEDDFQLAHEYQILENINEPQAQYNRDFIKSVDRYGKVMGEIANHNKAYTQIVISAGYLTFFGLWAVTKDNYFGLAHTLSGLSITVSAALFVLWEVFAMTIKGVDLDFKSKKLIEARFHDNLQNRADSLNSVNSRGDWLRLLLTRWWLRTLIPTVLFGVLGIAFLVWVFVGSLIDSAPQIVSVPHGIWLQFCHFAEQLLTWMQR